MLEENINYIQSTTEEMVDEIENEIGKEIAIEFLPNIVKTIGLESESQLERVTNMVRITSNTIKDRIRRNTNTRTMNLINTVNFSYETVDNLNKKTCNKTIDGTDELMAKKKIKKAA